MTVHPSGDVFCTGRLWGQPFPLPPLPRFPLPLLSSSSVVAVLPELTVELVESSSSSSEVDVLEPLRGVLLELELLLSSSSEPLPELPDGPDVLERFESSPSDVLVPDESSQRSSTVVRVLIVVTVLELLDETKSSSSSSSHAALLPEVLFPELMVFGVTLPGVELTLPGLDATVDDELRETHGIGTWSLSTVAM